MPPMSACGGPGTVNSEIFSDELLALIRS